MTDIRLTASAGAAGWPLLALILLSVSIPCVADAECKILQIAQFHVDMVDGQPAVDVAINGSEGKMLLDTGAEVSVLWRPAAEAMHLNLALLNGATLYGAGGGDHVERTTVADLTLGTYHAHDVDLMVAGNQKIAKGVIGVMGIDFFSKADIELDFANNAVRFLQPKGCSGEQLVYWGKAYSLLPLAASNTPARLQAFINLGDQRVMAWLDTGASESFVTPSIAERAGKPANPSAHSDRFHGIGALAVEGHPVVFSSIKIGDESVQNAELEVADLFSADKSVELGSRVPQSAIDAPDMLLGDDFFRAHRVYIARSQGQVYFSYNGGPIFAHPAVASPSPSPAPASASP